MFEPLLISAAGGLAKAGAQTLTKGLREASEEFAAWLGKEQPPQNATSPWSERLSNLASRIREWLGNKGGIQPFNLQFSLGASGKSELQVDGPAADQVKDFFDSNRGTEDELRQLANNIQQGFVGDSATSPVSISINERDWSVSTTG